MTTSSDRPQPRTRPRPATDEGQDPVVPTAAGPGTTTANPAAVTAHPETIRTGTTNPVVGQPGGGKTSGRRGAEPTVQLNVRVSADVNALIDAAADDTGHTKRQLIENAIRNTYS